MNNEFKEPDLSFSGELVTLQALDTRTIYFLARKSPPIIFSLSLRQKRSLLDYIKSIARESHTNDLLEALLLGGQTRRIQHIFKRKEMKLIDLVGENNLKKFLEECHNDRITREMLLQKLHRMIFSEKSSFAQSGIFVSGAVENLDSYAKDFNLQNLRTVKASLILACSADIQAYPFLGSIISKVSGDVGRLIVREDVPDRILDIDGGLVGSSVSFDDPLFQTREFTVGDTTLMYPQLRIDTSRAIRVALCPEYEKYDGAQRKADTIKVYGIEENIVREVVIKGRSRDALKQREARPNILQTDTLGRGEIGVFEIPIDIGMHDADIQTVCVNSEGKPHDIVHFPATFLDKLRTYPDGENRVQVEIYNCGSKPVRYRDIYFRIRLYRKSDDKKLESVNREKWRLRQDLQYGQQRGFTALDYLIRRHVLNVSRDDVEQRNLSLRQSGLGDLRNIDNLFREPHQEGLLFFKKEGLDRCEVVTSHHRSHLKLSDLVPSDVTGYQTDLLKLLQSACEIGREKRVIFVCRNDMRSNKLMAIIEKKKVTDVFCIPGRNSAVGPSHPVVELCQQKKIALTSISITSPEDDPDIILDLVSPGKNL